VKHMLEPRTAGPSQPPLPIAPPAFSAGAVISRTFEVVGHHSFPLAVAALLASAPSLVLTLAGKNDGPGSTFLDLFTGVLLTGAITAGVARALRGEHPRVGAMLGTAASRYFALFLLSLGSGLLTGLAAVALVIPGLMVWSGLFVGAPALLADPNLSSSEALRQSWNLTRGRRLPVFVVGITFLAILVAVAVGMAGLLALFGHAKTTLGDALGQLVLIPAMVLFDAAPVVAFAALRAEREGVDPARIGAVFE
jgi:hypothetical protein